MIWPFYLMAVVAVISTLKVVTQSNPVHALLNMIVSLLAVAGIFFYVGAPFAGALEVIVYAGAIMVLFVFVVMMLNLGSHTVDQEKLWLRSDILAWPALMSVLLALALSVMLLTGDTSLQNQHGHIYISPKDLGSLLFSHYVVVVEISAFLLLAALVAAFHLGKREPTNQEQEHDING